MGSICSVDERNHTREALCKIVSLEEGTGSTMSSGVSNASLTGGRRSGGSGSGSSHQSSEGIAVPSALQELGYGTEEAFKVAFPLFAGSHRFLGTDGPEGRAGCCWY